MLFRKLRMFEDQSRTQSTSERKLSNRSRSDQTQPNVSRSSFTTHVPESDNESKAGSGGDGFETPQTLIASTHSQPHGDDQQRKHNFIPLQTFEEAI